MDRGWRPPAALSALLTALAALVPAAADASVAITAKPGLRPQFSRQVSDYVSRCRPTKPLQLSVTAAGGDRVAIGAEPARAGTFSADLRRQAGQAFSIRIRSGGETTTHHVRCLPRDFPEWITDRSATPQAQWYVITPVGPHPHGYAAIFDAHGVPVWWWGSTKFAPWDAKLLPNGDVAWTRGYADPFGIRDREAYEERRLDGRLVRLVRTVGNPIDTHELTPMPNGHFLAITYRRRSGVDLTSRGGPRDGRVWDAEIQELTPGGKLVWSWNSKKHIALSETGQRWWDAQVEAEPRRSPEQRGIDLVHMNSLEPDGDGLIFSARHLDAVYRIDRRTGAIDWKLGGSHRAESLTVPGQLLGDLPFGGQHDARLYGDDTLTLFDNESRLDRPPRGLRMRIDTTTRTATLLDWVETSLVRESPFVGSARKLPGGNWVVCWGGHALVTEQTATGAPVLALRFQGSQHSYRAVPIMPGVLSARTLRTGMNRMNAPPTAGDPSRTKG
jgi:Arylsulfotransferase (ASST)